MALEHKTSNRRKSQARYKLTTKTNIYDSKLKGEAIAILNFDFLRLKSWNKLSTENYRNKEINHFTFVFRWNEWIWLNEF